MKFTIMLGVILIVLLGLIVLRKMGFNISDDSGSAEEYGIYMMNYYHHKDVSTIDDAIRFLDQTEIIQVKSHLGPICGFYSQVFRENPDKVSEWIKTIDSLSAKTRQMMAVSLWYSGVPEAKMYVENIESDELQQWPEDIVRRLHHPPVDLLTYYPSSPASNDMLFAAFTATGSPAFLFNIIDAATNYNTGESLDRFVIAATAKWGLTANAQVHELVMNALNGRMHLYSEAEQQILKDIIDKASDPYGPPKVLEETRLMVEKQNEKGIWLEPYDQQLPP